MLSVIIIIFFKVVVIFLAQIHLRVSMEEESTQSFTQRRLDTYLNILSSDLEIGMK